ncbi:MAG: hypothetical protein RLZZ116_1679 [Planctomycetota bacterium]|jgi:uncharacterized protein YcfL
MNHTTSARPLPAPAVRTALLAAVLGGVGLSACNTANTTQSGSARFGSNVHYERIVSNCWLNYKANVVGVREGTVSDNIKKVAVDVYSDQATTQRFNYKFEWFDAGGLPITSATATMTSVTIEPRQTLTLTAVAPAPNAAQWRLTFLDGKN